MFMLLKKEFKIIKSKNYPNFFNNQIVWQKIIKVNYDVILRSLLGFC